MKSLVEALGMECSGVARIATGFGAGMGRHGETCGALVGAVMALGLRYGREDGSDSEAKAKTYSKVDQLLCAFQKQFGTPTCRDLIGCDLRTPEGNERFKKEKLIVECRKFVEFAAREALGIASDE